MNKRVVFLLTIGFALGFSAHIISDKLYTENKTINVVENKVLGKASLDDFITHISYDGKNFSPRAVTIKKENYIQITNVSKDKKMWLVSSNPVFNTPRPYGEGETLKTILSVPGDYTVGNQLGPVGYLTVHVLP